MATNREEVIKVMAEGIQGYENRHVIGDMSPAMESTMQRAHSALVALELSGYKVYGYDPDEYYVVETATPHRYSGGPKTHKFTDRKSAMKFAESVKEGSWGQENYKSVKVMRITETVVVN